MSSNVSNDLTPLSLTKAREVLEIFIKLKRPVFLHGPVGVGKSDLIAQIGKDQNRKVIDLRMSQLDISDLRGIPFFNTSSGKMEWGAPVCLPHDKDDNCILFLDEINCASPSVQATAYQLILDRKVGDYVLPENVAVVAAGNRDSDRGATFKIATPLLNRFVHLEIKYDYNAWKKWATGAGRIHSAVVAYLADHQSELAHFDPKTSNRAFATPRSWKYVSDCLYELTQKSCAADPKLLQLMVEACVGDTTAAKFSKWYKMNGAVSVDDVISGRVTQIPPEARQVDFLLGFNHELSERLSALEKDVKTDSQRNFFHTAVDNSFAFVAESAGTNRDIPLSFITTLASKYQITPNQEKCPRIKTFLNNPEMVNFLHKAAALKYNNS